VTLSTYRHYTNIYLSIYLSKEKHKDCTDFVLVNQVHQLLLQKFAEQIHRRLTSFLHRHQLRVVLDGHYIRHWSTHIHLDTGTHYSIYWSQPSVCLSPAIFPHYCTDPDVTWGNSRGCPLVVHCWADLQSVHGFRCYNNIAPNTEYQRVLVPTLCLVTFVHISHGFGQIFTKLSVHVCKWTGQLMVM